MRTLHAAVFAGAVATIPLTILAEEANPPHWLGAAEWAVWIVFAIEYAVSLLLSGKRAEYVRTHKLDLAVVALSYPQLPVLAGLVRLARLARAVRLVRLAGVTIRALTALRAILGRRGLLYVSTATCLIVFASGAVLSILEPHTVRGGIGDGVWWAVVTASTVGYGDIAPTTLYGRIIAVFLMLSGIGLISTLAASITAHFVENSENPAMSELRERTARIECMLEAMQADQARTRASTYTEAASSSGDE